MGPDEHLRDAFAALGNADGATTPSQVTRWAATAIVHGLAAVVGALREPPELPDFVEPEG